MPQINEYKLVVVGDGGVGKSVNYLIHAYQASNSRRRFLNKIFKLGIDNTIDPGPVH